VAQAAPRAVLDSSVLVTRWSRVALQRLAAYPSTPYVPVWSEWIIAETWRVLAWRWLVRAGRTSTTEWNALTQSANEMMRYLLPVMTFVSLRDYAGPEPWEELRDLDDVPVWETAAAAGARYVISHNLADFPPLVDGRHLHQEIEYLTAIEFVEDVLGYDTVALAGGPVPVGGGLRSRRSVHE
jgi:hypothetical protein